MCVTLEPSPAAGGSVTRPVRDRGGVGGLDGGTTCSGTSGAPIPLASGRRSPTTGEGAICLRAPEPHVHGRGVALPVSRGACTAQLVRPWRAGVSVGPAQHCWCGPGVQGLLWGLHSTAGAVWRAGVPVVPAQHCWCGPCLRGFLSGLHRTAGAALACGGTCGACTALLVRPWRAGGSCGGCTAQVVRPWRAGVPVGPAQRSWCGPGVQGLLWGLQSTAGAALAYGGSCGACTALLVRPWRAGVSVGPAQHCWCGPGVQGLPVGPAQHSWCGPGVLGARGGGAQE